MHAAHCDSSYLLTNVILIMEFVYLEPKTNKLFYCKKNLQRKTSENAHKWKPHNWNPQQQKLVFEPLKKKLHNQTDAIIVY